MPRLSVPWTPEEVAVLRRSYPAVGGKGTALLLLSRTYDAICRKAIDLGLRSAYVVGKVARAQCRTFDDRFTPEMDALITKRYKESTGYRHIATTLSRELNLTPFLIRKRAGRLGLTRPAINQPWTDDEIEFLVETAHLTPEAAAHRFRGKGWRRSPTAIQIRRSRLGYRYSENGFLTAMELGQLLGTNGEQVSRWIRKGMLAATRQGTRRTDAQGDVYIISPIAVKKFVIAHTAHINLARVDKFWFVDLLTNLAT